MSNYVNVSLSDLINLRNEDKEIYASAKDERIRRENPDLIEYLDKSAVYYNARSDYVDQLISEAIGFETDHEYPTF